MVKVEVKTEYGLKNYYMEGYLKANLDNVKEILPQDNDLVGLIDGAEGAGKSLLAFQIATYLDPSFNLNRIVFTPRAFMNAIKNADKYQAIVYDEAFSGLMNRTSLTWTNIVIVKMLAEVRQKNLILIIVCPTFMDLDRYVAIWRTRFLINVYRGQKYERGYFKFFGYENKKFLYVEGKKTYNYFATKPDFHGRFTNFYTVPEDTYRRMKYEALVNRKDSVTQYQKVTDVAMQRYIIEKVAETKDLNRGFYAELIKTLHIKEPTFYKWLRESKEKLPKGDTK